MIVPVAKPAVQVVTVALIRSACYFELPLELRSEYLCFGLQPVVQGKPITSATPLVQLVGALADAALGVARKVEFS